MILTTVLLFFLFIILSAFFSMSETAFIAVKPHTLEYLEKKGSRRAGMVRKITARIDKLLTAILIGNNLVNTAAAALATSLATSLLGNDTGAILLATAGTTVFLLVFSEINPKIFATRHPLRISLLFAPVFRLLLVLFSPLVHLFGFPTRVLFRSRGKTPDARSLFIAEEEAKALLHSGLKSLPAHRKAMISEIVDLASRPVKEIMIPRPQIKAIEVSSSREQILKLVESEGFSRYPVYRGRMDHIEGVIYVKDLFLCLASGRPFELTAHLRKPFFVPESAPVEKVLLQMQEKGIQLALVVDEFGNMEGLVTLEDILEEIVGEIRDEYDAPEEDWHLPAEDGAVIIKGSAGIKEINKRLGLNLPESPDYTTLAGFLLSEFGRIPKEKDVLLHGGRRFIVVRMEKRRVGLVRVES
ncbi:MAG: HlyC/CorC family transporter [Candidatus Aminicenantes bacterium]|nr:HlyC/CorC family transporter [Candidatus Aminicenantes bacterium]